MMASLRAARARFEVDEPRRPAQAASHLSWKAGETAFTETRYMTCCVASSLRGRIPHAGRQKIGLHAASTRRYPVLLAHCGTPRAAHCYNCWFAASNSRRGEGAVCPLQCRRGGRGTRAILRRSNDKCEPASFHTGLLWHPGRRPMAHGSRWGSCGERSDGFGLVRLAAGGARVHRGGLCAGGGARHAVGKGIHQFFKPQWTCFVIFYGIGTISN